MNAEPSRLQRRLRAAAALLIAGLITMGVTLPWAHPTAFIAFIVAGGSLVALGMIVAVVALVGG